jgi:hypothetical protein
VPLALAATSWSNDAPREPILKAIRVVAAGQALASPSMTRRLIELFVDAPGSSPPTSSSQRHGPRTARAKRRAGQPTARRAARQSVLARRQPELEA